MAPVEGKKASGPRHKVSSRKAKESSDDDEDAYEEDPEEEELDKEEEAAAEDEESDDDAPPKVTFIPLPQLRDTGGVDYEDDRLHGNTLHFLKDLKKNNERGWLKCKASLNFSCILLASS